MDLPFALCIAFLETGLLPHSTLDLDLTGTELADWNYADCPGGATGLSVFIYCTVPMLTWPDWN